MQTAAKEEEKRRGMPLDMATLLSILQGYSSTSEVKYYIDEALDKFAEKRLRPLVDALIAERLPLQGGDAAATAPATPGRASPPLPSIETAHSVAATGAAGDEKGRAAAAAPSLTSSPSKPKPPVSGSVDVDWLAMVVRAQLETDLLQHTQLLVRKEVLRELAVVAHGHGPAAAVQARAAQPTSPPPSSRPPLPPPSTPSPTRSALPAEAEAAARHSPPPPRLFRGLEEEEEDDGRDGGDAGRHEADALKADGPPPTAEDAGRKQRERILNAIHDVERQLSGVQRQVNELAHQHRLGQQRMATFFAAAHSGSGQDDASVTGSSVPPSSARHKASPETSTTSAVNYSTFYTTLLQALDERELPKVRAMAQDTVTALTPSPSPPPPPPVAAASAGAQSHQRSAAACTPPRTTPAAVGGSSTTTTAMGTELLNVSAATSATRTEQPALLPRPHSPALGATPSPSRGEKDAEVPVIAPLSHGSSSALASDEDRLGHVQDMASLESTLRAAAATAGEGTQRTPQRLTASAGVVASGSRGGDTVPPPPPSLQTSHSLASALASATAAADAYSPAHRTSKAVAAQLSRAAASARPVAAAAQRLASLLDSGSGTRRPHSSTTSHNSTTTIGTPVEQTLQLSVADSPPSLTNGAWAQPQRAPHSHATRQPAASLYSPLPARDGEASARVRKSLTPTVTAGDITLGVDAIDLPAGVLPSALGLRGGVRVLAVGRGQLAERSGVAAGDVVIAVSGRVIETCAQLQRALREAQAQPTQQPRLDLYRQAANLVITVSLDV